MYKSTTKLSSWNVKYMYDSEKLTMLKSAVTFKIEDEEKILGYRTVISLGSPGWLS